MLIQNISSYGNKKAGGIAGFNLTEKTPSGVMIHGKDFTKGYERSENVYVADFPETDSKMLLSVSWDNIGEMEHRN